MTATSATPPTPRLVLRNLTFPARLVLTVFLLSVGIGYVSAIVNLHMQEASPGEAVPTPDDVKASYHGKTKVSQMERLLTANPDLPFNGQGSMRSAFTRRRVGSIKGAVKAKEAQIKEKAEEEKRDLNDPAIKAQLDKAELERKVMEDIDGERIALIAWVRAGYPKEAYEDEKTGFLLTGPLKDLPVSESYINTVGNKDAKEGIKRYAKISMIVENRCVRCHQDKASAVGAGQYPLETYEDVAHYCKVEAPTGKSLTKLALSTHVHLLGFSMLYGLTGFIFAFSRWPFLVRLVLCPLPLVAQICDISCWWLARLDGPLGETFAGIIPITGGIVALGLVAQILISVFDMYGWLGRFILALLFAGVIGAGAVFVHPIVQDYLKHEVAVKAEQSAEKKTDPPPPMPKAE